MTGSQNFNGTDDLPILAEIGAELGRLFGEQDARGARRSPLSWKLPLRSRVALSIAAVLVTASAAAAAVTLSAARSQPLHIPHGGIECPAGYPDLASSQTGLVYPTDFPGAYPRTDHGTSCYASIGAAVADKYKLAPTPTRDVQFGGFFMGPASASDNDLCTRARHFAGAVIYCPTMLPVPVIHQPNLDCPRAGCTYFSLSSGFVGPNNYRSASYAGGGQISIWAWSTKQSTQSRGQEACESPRKGSSTTFRGHQAEWLQCPVEGGLTPLFDSADIKVLEWQIGREHYGVSADGPAGRKLVIYVATHLKPEAPIG